MSRLGTATPCKMNENVWKSFFEYLEKVPRADCSENAAASSSALTSASPTLDVPLTIAAKSSINSEAFSAETVYLRENYELGESQQQNIVVLSDSDTDDEPISSKSGYKRLREKARCLVFHRFITTFMRYSNSSKEAAFDNITEDHLFPYERLKELSKDLQKFQQEFANNEKDSSFLWNNVVQWLLAVKLSLDPMDINNERFNLILIDLMVQYLNYITCIFCNVNDETKIKEKVSEVVQTLTVILNGNVSHVLMVLLRIELKAKYRSILVPIFRKYLTDRSLRHTSNDLVVYLRLIFCFKRWKMITPLKTDREAINEIAVGKSMRTLKREGNTDVVDLTNEFILPKSVPRVNVHNESFISISDLIGFAIKHKTTGTRILLVYTSLDLEKAISKYFQLYERYVSRNASADILATLCEDTSRLHMGTDATNTSQCQNIQRINSNDASPCQPVRQRERKLYYAAGKASKHLFQHRSTLRQPHLFANCDTNKSKLGNSTIGNVSNLRSRNTNTRSDITLSSKSNSSINNLINTSIDLTINDDEHAKMMVLSSSDEESCVRQVSKKSNKESEHIQNSDTLEKSLTTNENILIVEQCMPRIAAIPPRCRPLRKEKNCIPGEVSSTTSPDFVMQNKNLQHQNEESSLNLTATSEQTSTSFGFNQSVLEVHSAGGILQSGREVGVVKALKHRVDPCPPANQRAILLGLYYDDVSSENDDEEESGEKNEDENVAKSQNLPHRNWKVVKEATSSTSEFPKVLSNNVIFSTRFDRSQFHGQTSETSMQKRQSKRCSDDENKTVQTAINQTNENNLKDLSKTCTIHERPMCSKYIQKNNCDQFNDNEYQASIPEDGTINIGNLLEIPQNENLQTSHVLIADVSKNTDVEIKDGVNLSKLSLNTEITKDTCQNESIIPSTTEFPETVVVNEINQVDHLSNCGKNTENSTETQIVISRQENEKPPSITDIPDKQTVDEIDDINKSREYSDNQTNMHKKCLDSKQTDLEKIQTPILSRPLEYAAKCTDMERENQVNLDKPSSDFVIHEEKLIPNQKCASVPTEDTLHLIVRLEETKLKDALKKDFRIEPNEISKITQVDESVNDTNVQLVKGKVVLIENDVKIPVVRSEIKGTDSTKELSTCPALNSSPEQSAKTNNNEKHSSSLESISKCYNDYPLKHSKELLDFNNTNVQKDIKNKNTVSKNSKHSNSTPGKIEESFILDSNIEVSNAEYKKIVSTHTSHLNTTEQQSHNSAKAKFVATDLKENESTSKLDLKTTLEKQARSGEESTKDKITASKFHMLTNEGTTFDQSIDTEAVRVENQKNISFLNEPDLLIRNQTDSSIFKNLDNNLTLDNNLEIEVVNKVVELNEVPPIVQPKSDSNIIETASEIVNPLCNLAKLDPPDLIAFKSVVLDYQESCINTDKQHSDSEISKTIIPKTGISENIRSNEFSCIRENHSEPSESSEIRYDDVVKKTLSLASNIVYKEIHESNKDVPLVNSDKDFVDKNTLVIIKESSKNYEVTLADENVFIDSSISLKVIDDIKKSIHADTEKCVDNKSELKNVEIEKIQLVQHDEGKNDNTNVIQTQKIAIEAQNKNNFTNVLKASTFSTEIVALDDMKNIEENLGLTEKILQVDDKKEDTYQSFKEAYKIKNVEFDGNNESIIIAKMTKQVSAERSTEEQYLHKIEICKDQKYSTSSALIKVCDQKELDLLKVDKNVEITGTSILNNVKCQANETVNINMDITKSGTKNKTTETFKVADEVCVDKNKVYDENESNSLIDLNKTAETKENNEITETNIHSNDKNDEMQTLTSKFTDKECIREINVDNESELVIQKSIISTNMDKNYQTEKDQTCHNIKNKEIIAVVSNDLDIELDKNVAPIDSFKESHNAEKYVKKTWGDEEHLLKAQKCLTTYEVGSPRETDLNLNKNVETEALKKSSNLNNENNEVDNTILHLESKSDESEACNKQNALVIKDISKSKNINDFLATDKTEECHQKKIMLIGSEPSPSIELRTVPSNKFLDFVKPFSKLQLSIVDDIEKRTSWKMRIKQRFSRGFSEFNLDSDEDEHRSDTSSTCDVLENSLQSKSFICSSVVKDDDELALNISKLALKKKRTESGSDSNNDEDSFIAFEDAWFRNLGLLNNKRGLSDLKTNEQNIQKNENQNLETVTKPNIDTEQSFDKMPTSYKEEEMVAVTALMNLKNKKFHNKADINVLPTTNETSTTAATTSMSVVPAAKVLKSAFKSKTNANVPKKKLTYDEQNLMNNKALRKSTNHTHDFKNKSKKLRTAEAKKKGGKKCLRQRLAEINAQFEKEIILMSDNIKDSNNKLINNHEAPTASKRIDEKQSIDNAVKPGRGRKKKHMIKQDMREDKQNTIRSLTPTTKNKQGAITAECIYPVLLTSRGSVKAVDTLNSLPSSDTIQAQPSINTSNTVKGKSISKAETVTYKPPNENHLLILPDIEENLNKKQKFETKKAVVRLKRMSFNKNVSTSENSLKENITILKESQIKQEPVEESEPILLQPNIVETKIGQKLTNVSNIVNKTFKGKSSRKEIIVRPCDIILTEDIINAQAYELKKSSTAETNQLYKMITSQRQAVEHIKLETTERDHCNKTRKKLVEEVSAGSNLSAHEFIEKSVCLESKNVKKADKSVENNLVGNKKKTSSNDKKVSNDLGTTAIVGKKSQASKTKYTANEVENEFENIHKIVTQTLNDTRTEEKISKLKIVISKTTKTSNNNKKSIKRIPDIFEAVVSVEDNKSSDSTKIEKILTKGKTLLNKTETNQVFDNSTTKKTCNSGEVSIKENIASVSKAKKSIKAVKLKTNDLTGGKPSEIRTFADGSKLHETIKTSKDNENEITKALIPKIGIKESEKIIKQNAEVETLGNRAETFEITQTKSKDETDETNIIITSASKYNKNACEEKTKVLSSEISAEEVEVTQTADDIIVEKVEVAKTADDTEKVVEKCVENKTSENNIETKQTKTQDITVGRKTKKIVRKIKVDESIENYEDSRNVFEQQTKVLKSEIRVEKVEVGKTADDTEKIVEDKTLENRIEAKLTKIKNVTVAKKTKKIGTLSSKVKADESLENSEDSKNVHEEKSKVLTSEIRVEKVEVAKTADTEKIVGDKTSEVKIETKQTKTKDVTMGKKTKQIEALASKVTADKTIKYSEDSKNLFDDKTKVLTSEIRIQAGDIPKTADDTNTLKIICAAETKGLAIGETAKIKSLDEATKFFEYKKYTSGENAKVLAAETRVEAGEISDIVGYVKISEVKTPETRVEAADNTQKINTTTTIGRSNEEKSSQIDAVKKFTGKRTLVNNVKTDNKKTFKEMTKVLVSEIAAGADEITKNVDGCVKAIEKIAEVATLENRVNAAENTLTTDKNLIGHERYASETIDDSKTSQFAGVKRFTEDVAVEKTKKIKTDETTKTSKFTSEIKVKDDNATKIIDSTEAAVEELTTSKDRVKAAQTIQTIGSESSEIKLQEDDVTRSSEAMNQDLTSGIAFEANESKKSVEDVELVVEKRIKVIRKENEVEAAQLPLILSNTDGSVITDKTSDFADVKKSTKDITFVEQINVASIPNVKTESKMEIITKAIDNAEAIAEKSDLIENKTQLDSDDEIRKKLDHSIEMVFGNKNESNVENVPLNVTSLAISSEKDSGKTSTSKSIVLEAKSSLMKPEERNSEITTEQLDRGIDSILGPANRASKQNKITKANEEEKFPTSKQKLGILTAQKINALFVERTTERNKNSGFECDIEKSFDESILKTFNKIKQTSEELTTATSSTREHGTAKKTVSKKSFADVKIVSANVPERVFADDESDNSSNGENSSHESYFPSIPHDDVTDNIKGDSVELPTNLEEANASNLETLALSSISDITTDPYFTGFPDILDQMLQSQTQAQETTDCMISGKNYVQKWSESSYAHEAFKNKGEEETKNLGAVPIPAPSQNHNICISQIFESNTNAIFFDEADVSTNIGFDLDGNVTVEDLLAHDSDDLFPFSELDKSNSRSNSFSSDSEICTNSVNDACEDISHATKTIACDHSYNKEAKEHDKNKSQIETIECIQGVNDVSVTIPSTSSSMNINEINKDLYKMLDLDVGLPTPISIPKATIVERSSIKSSGKHILLERKNSQELEKRIFENLISSNKILKRSPISTTYKDMPFPRSKLNVNATVFWRKQRKAENLSGTKSGVVSTEEGNKNIFSLNEVSSSNTMQTTAPPTTTIATPPITPPPTTTTATPPITPPPTTPPFTPTTKQPTTSPTTSPNTSPTTPPTTPPAAAIFIGPVRAPSKLKPVALTSTPTTLKTITLTSAPTIIPTTIPATVSTIAPITVPTTAPTAMSITAPTTAPTTRLTGNENISQSKEQNFHVLDVDVKSKVNEVSTNSAKSDILPDSNSKHMNEKGFETHNSTKKSTYGSEVTSDIKSETKKVKCKSMCGTQITSDDTTEIVEKPVPVTAVEAIKINSTSQESKPSSIIQSKDIDTCLTTPLKTTTKHPAIAIQSQPIITIHSQTNRLQRMDQIPSQSAVSQDYSILPCTRNESSTREHTPTLDEESFLEERNSDSANSSSGSRIDRSPFKRENTPTLDEPPQKKICLQVTSEKLSSNDIFDILKKEPSINIAICKSPLNEVSVSSDSSKVLMSVSSPPPHSEEVTIETIEEEKDDKLCGVTKNIKSSFNVGNVKIQRSDSKDLSILTDKQKIINTRHCSPEIVQIDSKDRAILTHQKTKNTRSSPNENVYISLAITKRSASFDNPSDSVETKTNLDESKLIKTKVTASNAKLNTLPSTVVKSSGRISPVLNKSSSTETSNRFIRELTHVIEKSNTNIAFSNKISQMATSKSPSDKMDVSTLSPIKSSTHTSTNNSKISPHSSSKFQVAKLNSKEVTTPTLNVNNRYHPYSQSPNDVKTNRNKYVYQRVPSLSEDKQTPKKEKNQLSNTVQPQKLTNNIAAEQQIQNNIPRIPHKSNISTLATNFKLSESDEKEIAAKLKAYSKTLPPAKIYREHVEQRLLLEKQEEKLRLEMRLVYLEREKQRQIQQYKAEAQRLKRKVSNESLETHYKKFGSSSKSSSSSCSRQQQQQHQQQQQRQQQQHQQQKSHHRKVYVNKFSEIEKKLANDSSRKCSSSINETPMTTPTAWEPKAPSVDEIMEHLSRMKKS